jgi:hypothetical protein
MNNRHSNTVVTGNSLSILFPHVWLLKCSAYKEEYRRHNAHIT